MMTQNSLLSDSSECVVKVLMSTITRIILAHTSNYHHLVIVVTVLSTQRIKKTMFVLTVQRVQG